MCSCCHAFLHSARLQTLHGLDHQFTFESSLFARYLFCSCRVTCSHFCLNILPPLQLLPVTIIQPPTHIVSVCLLFAPGCTFCAVRGRWLVGAVARLLVAAAARPVAAAGSASRPLAAAAAAAKPLLEINCQPLRPPASSLAGNARRCSLPSLPDRLALVNHGKVHANHTTHVHVNSQISPRTQPNVYTSHQHGHENHKRSASSNTARG